MGSQNFAQLLMIVSQVLSASRADSPPSFENETFKPEPRFNQVQDLIVYPESKYHALVYQGASDGCTQSYQLTQPGQSVTLTSPNYNGEYPDNVDRSVCFSSPPGTTMSFECEDFDVEHHPKCQYDYLGIGLSGDPSNTKKYCGRGVVRSPATSGNSLTIVFRSDKSNPGIPYLTRSPHRFKFKVDGDCTCGRRNGVSRIVGGTNAGLNEFPWRCYLKSNTKPYICGCSIISNQWILTAAHCTSDDINPLPQGDVLYVVVGAHNRDSTGEQIPVEKVHNHPLYILSIVVDNDISLLKLSRPITFNNEVSPVCLPFIYANDEFEGTTVTASGWGRTIEADTNSLSNTLQKVELPVITNADCQRHYPGEITETMICTYQPGTSVCRGDSGSSIDLNRNGRYYNIAVVSWGKSCGGPNDPAVYARTTKFLNWITSTTGENFCRV